MTVITQPDWFGTVPATVRIESFYDYPDLQFMNKATRERIEKQIRTGELQSFCVRVDYVIYGFVLGTDWLSGCIYKDLDEFVNTIEYFQDMVRNAKQCATDNLWLLKSIPMPPQ